VVYRHGGILDSTELTELSEQALLAGLTVEETAALAKLGTVRTYQPGQRIIAAEAPASSLYFLRSGVVHVKLPSGIRLATLSAGMVFGEMSLLEAKRSADVLADKSVTCSKCRSPTFSIFGKRTRASANASCATWRSCSPTA
jgi:glutaminase